MQYCLTSNTSDCRNCYKCIRHCPIKAISFRDDKAEIIAEDCILCGKCYNVCPQHLKEIRNDTEKVRRKGHRLPGSELHLPLPRQRSHLHAQHTAEAGLH